MVTVPDSNGIPILGQPEVPQVPTLPPTLVTSMLFGPIVINAPDGPMAAVEFEFALPDGTRLPRLLLVADDENLLQLPDLLRKAIREARRAAESMPDTEEEQ